VIDVDSHRRGGERTEEEEDIFLLRFILRRVTVVLGQREVVLGCGWIGLVLGCSTG
jgi:hypothetical protein